MMMYERFAFEINSILPLPTDERFVSGDGIKKLDTAKSGKQIQIIIRRYKKEYDLQPDDMQKLKNMVIKRFDLYTRSWNKKNR